MSKVLVNGKHVRVTTSGEVKWNPDPKAVDLIVARAIGMVRKRTTEGIDGHGKAFEAYSDEYAEAKAEAGRGTNVNLTVTQTLLRSVAERARSILLDRAEVTIGPGQGPHPVYSLGEGRVHRGGGLTVGESRVLEGAKDLGRSNKEGGTKEDRRIAREARALVKARRGARAARAPSTNSIGYWLHKGTKHLPPRPWLMLTDQDRKRLGAMIQRMAARLFRPR